jgi:ATP-binding cassette, subfamily B, bacterial
MLKRILAYAKPYQKTIIAIALMIVLMAGLMQAEPFITKAITDILVEKQASNELGFIVQLLGLLLIIKLVIAVFNRISWYLTNIFVVKFEIHLKQIAFDHLMGLSLSYFSNQATGKVMSKLDRGVNRIISIVNNSGMHFLPSAITALISFSIVLYYEWRIGVMTVVAFIPYIFINRWRFNKNNVLEKREYKLYDNQYSHFWEVLNSMQLIKAFRAEVFEKTRLNKFFSKYLGIRKEMEKNTNKAFAGDLILEALSWSMYAYIVWITWQGQISIGTLILLVGLIGLIKEPLWTLNWIFWEVKRAQIGARDFFKIMDVLPVIIDPKNPKQLKKVKGRIDFKKVNFTYKSQEKDSKDLKVFDSVSFSINAGETTAFVGPSGSGKTTIASLVMRFFDPDSGSITLDKINLKDLSQKDLRSHMSLVSQDAYLFADSIEENLKYAKPNATKQEMEDALEVAYAKEFIDKLPKGLKTEIGERGVKLSGGQRQRLSIARAVLQNPEIIILDEATSSLDSESEMYIQQALAKLLQNRTAIVIAHRLSTIQRADKIIVIKDKKVLESGSHQELLSKDGLYTSLFKIQSGDSEKLKEWDLVA